MALPLVIHSSTTTSRKHLFNSIARLSWIAVNYLNQNPCMPLWPGVFQFSIFLVLFWVNRCVFSSSVLLWVLSTLFPYCLSIWLFYKFSWLSLLALKLFCFLCIRLLIILHSKTKRRFFFKKVEGISHYFLEEFFLFILECPDFTVLFYPVTIYFNRHSFASTTWFISSSWIVIFTCVAFSFLSPKVPAFFLCLSSSLLVEVDFLVLRGTLIFSQTYFAPA